MWLQYWPSRNKATPSLLGSQDSGLRTGAVGGEGGVGPPEDSWAPHRFRILQDVIISGSLTLASSVTGAASLYEAFGRIKKKGGTIIIPVGLIDRLPLIGNTSEWNFA